MICSRMLSWSKFSTCATWCCTMINRLRHRILRFAIIKFYLLPPKPESSNLYATPSPSKDGSRKCTTGNLLPLPVYDQLKTNLVLIGTFLTTWNIDRPNIVKTNAWEIWQKDQSDGQNFPTNMPANWWGTTSPKSIKPPSPGLPCVSTTLTVLLPLPLWGTF